jgi:hypothetical protein
VSEMVTTAIEERLEGGQPGRAKAFAAAVGIGVAAFLASYRLLRSGGDNDEEES